jgi:plasmid stabilization system protein ParE
MARLRWTERAATQLTAICDCIGRDSEHYARIFARRVAQATEGIADFPQSGRLLQRRPDGEVRQKVLGDYRITYMATSEVVHILSIVHGARSI